jgi:hypothetical protein
VENRPARGTPDTGAGRSGYTEGKRNHAQSEKDSSHDRLQ